MQEEFCKKQRRVTDKHLINWRNILNLCGALLGGCPRKEEEFSGAKKIICKLFMQALTTLMCQPRKAAKATPQSNYQFAYIEDRGALSRSARKELPDLKENKNMCII